MSGLLHFRSVLLDRGNKLIDYAPIVYALNVHLSHRDVRILSRTWKCLMRATRKGQLIFVFFFPSSFNISPPSDFDEEATYYVCKCLITRVSFVRQIRRHPTNVRECAKNLHVARRAAFYSGRGQKRNQFRRYKCHGRTLFLSSANHSTPD